MRLARTVAALIVVFLFAQGSFATGLIPKKGQRVAFERAYSTDHLKNHPLQFTKKTEFTVANVNGMLVGTWKSTMRDPGNDETAESEASAICRPRGTRKLECAFGADQNTVIVSSRADGGAQIEIPLGQGVGFDEKTEEGRVAGEFLLGDDDANNFFRLNAKKSKR